MVYDKGGAGRGEQRALLLLVSLHTPIPVSTGSWHFDSLKGDTATTYNFLHIPVLENTFIQNIGILKQCD